MRDLVTETGYQLEKKKIKGESSEMLYQTSLIKAPEAKQTLLSYWWDLGPESSPLKFLELEIPYLIKT